MKNKSIRDSVALAQRFVRAEKVHRFLKKQAATNPNFEKKFREQETRLKEIWELVQKDLMARELIDQARKVIEAEKAREKAILGTGLGDLEQLLSDLGAIEHQKILKPGEEAHDNPGPANDLYDLDFEQLCARFEEAYKSERKLESLRYLAEIVRDIRVKILWAELPPLVGYKFDIGPPRGSIH